MLLRFSARNYRSLATEQEVLLTESRLGDDEGGLISVEGFPQGVLPVIAIYGPNASGKSNLLKAINFVADGVRGSYKKPVDTKIARMQFKLAECDDSCSTSMELDFIVRDFRIGHSTQNVRFTYGFKITDEAVEEEWLYAYPSGHRQVWFHRNRAESPEYYFGRSLKGQNRVISELTRSDVLFLSMAFVNNHALLTPVYKFITEGILIRLDDLSFDEKSSIVRFLENDTLRERILGFLRNADTGICDAQVTEVDLSGSKAAEVFQDLTSLVERYYPDDNQLKKEFNTLKKKLVRLGHTGDSGPVYLNLADESRGTLAFLELIGMVLVALETGSVLVVDEFDSSLHPILSKQVIQLFNSKSSNPKGAQLLFSTHDVSMLSRDILRRDQIYFVEKDTGGRSNVYPLTSLKTKKLDNIQKGYMEGRYGAIPFLGDFEALVGGERGEKISKNKIA